MSLVGQVQVILGPMFSGKTTELLRRIRRYTIAKRKCVVIKYNKDTRYDAECAATHDRQTEKAIAAGILSDVPASVLSHADVVGIDEGQFFSDVVEFSETMANQGKVVIVAALDGTFERKPFGSILNLIPLAEQVIKLSAVCMICNEEAAFTKRLSEETKVEVIGGQDKYISTCRRCFVIKVQPSSPSTLTDSDLESPPSPASPQSEQGPSDPASPSKAKRKIDSSSEPSKRFCEKEQAVSS
eukprot:TRINITY_DN15474_c0_g1_i2.p1 TRINITY_DN15474_c0_g1~~TRINITY_DN15474_c0_g1_i2.p1  ORF type:complete len:242 (+),score=20.43 TRINITY_DN15474_c0_g1_i2:108-833(+)